MTQYQCHFEQALRVIDVNNRAIFDIANDISDNDCAIKSYQTNTASLTPSFIYNDKLPI